MVYPRPPLAYYYKEDPASLMLNRPAYEVMVEDDSEAAYYDNQRPVIVLSKAATRPKAYAVEVAKSKRILFLTMFTYFSIEYLFS